MSQYEIFTKLVIAFFAVSSLSFNMFILALCCTYKCDWLRDCTQPRDEEPHQPDEEPHQPDEEPPKLEPFFFTQDDLFARQKKHEEQQRQQEGTEIISTTLHLPESMYFFFLLVFNVSLWIICIVLLVCWHYNKESYYNSKLSITADATGFSVYMYSLFCTIVSCFTLYLLQAGKLEVLKSIECVQ